MNVFALLLPAVVLYFLAQRFYARRLERVFGVDDARPTPAVTHADGVDFVATRPNVLFAHHFSAIAAAGPIIGPTMALLYGYVPALLWIVVGAILIGAVHDFACLYVSVREDGRSIADVARRMLGRPAFVLFALFIAFNLVVVNAVFIKLTATSLTSLRAPQDMGLPAGQTIFRTITTEGGQRMAVVGGIASTSAVALTLVAPLLGFAVIRRHMPKRYAYPLATVLCLGSVLVGFAAPINMPPLELGWLKLSSTQVWVVLIALYVWLAAALPVWLVLQPREFVSVQFLYLGIGLLIAALCGAGLKGVTVAAPPADFALGEQALGALWPTLFVTIACGAVSGFHGMVASGTTSKQLARESDAKNIGYLGMLGESVLALCVTLAIAVGVSHTEYASFLVRPADAPANWQANPVLAFSVGVAGVCHEGLGIPKWLGLVFGLLMVEGFVLDTLDVSVRLNRYLLEEIWAVAFRRVPAILHNYWFNAGLAVLAMLALAFAGTADALWPIFGSGNQLLAALALLVATIWLIARGRPARHVFIPAVLVGATTIASLIYLLATKYLPRRNVLLAVTDAAFLLLAAGVALFAWQAAGAARRAAHSRRHQAELHQQP